MLRRLAVLPALVLFLACVLHVWHPAGSAFSYLFADLRLHLGDDSTNGMDRAWAALRARQPVYETVFFQEHTKFQYPIPSMLLYSVAAVAHISGYRLNQMLMVVSFPAILLVSGEIFLLALPPGRMLSGWERGFARGCIVVAGCLFCPLVIGLNLAQVQVLLTFLWAFAVYLWLRNLAGWSGVCIALICIFKPQMAVFALWAVVRREWRFLVPFLVVTALGQAAAIALFGWHNEVEYLAVVSFLSRHGEVFHANQSVNGLLQRIAGTGDPLRWERNGFPPYSAFVYRGTLLSTSILMSLGLVMPLWRPWRSSTFDFVLFGMISAVASPIAWEHHYSSFFVAGVFLLAGFGPKTGKLLAGFVVCFLVLASPLAGVRLPGVSTVLLSQDLWAGFGLILLAILLAERATAGELSGYELVTAANRRGLRRVDGGASARHGAGRGRLIARSQTARLTG